MKAQHLRQLWLDFFREKQHQIIPSASLVPENNASVLYTMAGMFPLVPYLLGQTHPLGTRLANIQKCIRTGDIEDVGDNTHLTFFEMMGNWSLGDYFKKEAITWSFEFLTSEKWLNIPLSRLAFTVFEGDETAPRDEESAKLWQECGVSPERIGYLGKADNWWIAGTSGPCGPDTEMFYWIDDGTPAPVNYQETKDDKRWVEIWNNVFMQYNQLPTGELEPLAKPNVDTGMGLDRVLAVLSGQKSVYDTELFKSLFDVIGADQSVLTNDEVKRARVVVDHVRAAVFITADGVVPTNKDRGYILRRLLRRAMVMAKLLGLSEHWLKALVGQVIAEYAVAYSELKDRSEEIFAVIEGEQKKFSATLTNGLKQLEKYIQNGKISGQEAFDLYQSLGFPIELTMDLAKQAGVEVDYPAFQAEQQRHQELSRTASSGEFKGGMGSGDSAILTRYHTATHLLHQALRQVLGPEVWQKGSNITEERARFDFTHGAKMTDAEKAEVEKLVNDWIAVDATVDRVELPFEQAKSLGAIGLFGEKYGDMVSVYTVTNPVTDEVISREFCGGPHVTHTGEIGKFKILKEEAVAAGIRRIKAIIE